MSDGRKYLVHPCETEAPERIWVWGWRADSVWQEQTWQHEDEPISTMEYVRADLFAELTEQLAAARRDAEEKAIAALPAVTLKPAPTVTAGWPTEEGEGSIIVGKVKGGIKKYDDT